MTTATADEPTVSVNDDEPLRDAQVEAYVSRAELARIMGVCVSTIDAMRREGMPSTTWGKRTRRFKPSTAIAWAQERSELQKGELR